MNNSQDTSGRRIGLFATAGAVVTAVLSSACCWLPLLRIAFGASAAGVSSFFEAHRFWFLGATAVLLAIGFYLAYFRKAKCEPDSACAAPNPRQQRFNRVMLWVATAVVVVFGFFPNYLPILLGRTGSGPTQAAPVADQVIFMIDGMTCESCAVTLGLSDEMNPGMTRTDEGRYCVVMPMRTHVAARTAA